MVGLEEIAVLVKPIDYPLNLDNLVKCENCGSTILRVKREYGVLKKEYFDGKPREEEPFRDVCCDTEFFCAVCGLEMEGYEFYGSDVLEKRGFDSAEEAKEYLTENEKLVPLETQL